MDSGGLKMLDTRTALEKKERAEFLYEQMVQRCEIHNCEAETITRMATPEETERYIELLENDKHERELAAKEKAMSYGVGSSIC